MPQWTLLTCPLEGDAFIESRELSWPVPLTGEVHLLLRPADGSPAREVEFELQTDFASGFSAFSSDGRFALDMRYTEALEGRRYLTGAVTRHEGDSEAVEAFTAVTSVEGRSDRLGSA